jgi:hypothetical protein
VIKATGGSPNTTKNGTVCVDPGCIIPGINYAYFNGHRQISLNRLAMSVLRRLAIKADEDISHLCWVHRCINQKHLNIEPSFINVSRDICRNAWDNFVKFGFTSHVCKHPGYPRCLMWNNYAKSSSLRR